MSSLIVSALCVSEMKLPYDEGGGVLVVDNVLDIGDPENAVENQAYAR